MRGKTSTDVSAETQPFIGDQAQDTELRATRAREYSPDTKDALAALALRLDDTMSASETGRSFAHTPNGWVHTYDVLVQGHPEQELLETGVTQVVIENAVVTAGKHTIEEFEVAIDHYEAAEFVYGSIWRFQRLGGKMIGMEVCYSMDEAVQVFSAQPGAALPKLFNAATTYDIANLTAQLDHVSNQPQAGRQYSSESY
jgi:hypothetical protein